jgi:YHS domain-containing protein
VRGSKGSKVLRTRKLKIHNPNYIHMYSYFCSNGCYNEFANKYIEQIIRIAPRLEPLETRIEDPKKETHESRYGGYTYTSTIINKIDNDSNVG